MLDIEFAPLIPEPEPPPPLTTEVAAVGEGEIDAVVSWFSLRLDATRVLHTGPEDTATGSGNSCWEQAVHLAPRRPEPLSCGVGDKVWIDASYSDTSPHFTVRTNESEGLRSKYTHFP